MEKKCLRCGNEDDFFESSLIGGVICNDCGVMIDEGRARAYARGYEMGEESIEETFDKVE